MKCYGCRADGKFTHTHSAHSAHTFAPKWVVHLLIALVAYFPALKLLIAIVSAATATSAVAIAFCATLMRQRICRSVCASTGALIDLPCGQFKLHFEVEQIRLLLLQQQQQKQMRAGVVAFATFWCVCKHGFMQTIACFAALTHLGFALIWGATQAVRALCASRYCYAHERYAEHSHTLWQCHCIAFLCVN